MRVKTLLYETINIFATLQVYFFALLIVSLLGLLNAGLPPPRHQLRVKRQGNHKKYHMCASKSIILKHQDAPNGCDPNTGIGGFLLFPALKAWCEEQGATEFGVYGRK